MRRSLIFFSGLARLFLSFSSCSRCLFTRSFCSLFCSRYFPACLFSLSSLFLFVLVALSTFCCIVLCMLILHTPPRVFFSRDLFLLSCSHVLDAYPACFPACVFFAFSGLFLLSRSRFLYISLSQHVVRVFFLLFCPDCAVHRRSCGAENFRHLAGGEAGAKQPRLDGRTVG